MTLYEPEYPLEPTSSAEAVRKNEDLPRVEIKSISGRRALFTLKEWVLILRKTP